MAVWSKLMAGLRAFRKAYMSAETPDGGEFTEFDARKLRYAVLWAFYENTAYDEVHTWAKGLRSSYGLYRYTRNIYNPAYRLAEFWVTHLTGGLLDMEAGDGQQTPSALPIVTGNEQLRPVLAQLWRDSNWQIKKANLPRYGSVFGDVGLRVVDDAARRKVYLEIVHPAIIKSVTLDPFGNVKAYAFEEERPDPTGKSGKVRYRETAERDGDLVVYRTYLNDHLYAWNDVTAEWDQPYGFVPLVMVRHLDVGLDWGWSEYHTALGKIRECDDIASKLSDQIRKTVDTPWLFSGVTPPAETPTIGQTAATTTVQQPGREEVPIFYGPSGAQATPLVAPLDISGTLQHIQSILQELERDYPELRSDIATASGDASGRALRVARQAAEAKVIARRPTYDNALVRAHQMAIAIGGFQGYEGYEGFGLESYDAGQLDHSIGTRPVFGVDPVDELEEEQLFWQTAKAADEAGVPIELFLEDHGWAPDQVARVRQERERRQREAMAIAQRGSNEAANEPAQAENV